MTPEARIAAAIEVLDVMLDGSAHGKAMEQALTGWARGHRFAGSKDRAAIRDHVFGAWRCRRSFAAWGGTETGRGLMIGALRAAGTDPGLVFSGQGYAPVALSDDEIALETTPEAGSAQALDCQDWLLPLFQKALGDQTEDVLMQMQARAPIYLRANLRKTTRDEAITALGGEGIVAQAHGLSPSALEVVEGARKIRLSAAFADGLVELQDAASQAVSDMVPLPDGARVLDYCAGGGGKTLALAARVAPEADVAFFAFDINAARLKDLAPRAERAGAVVKTLTPSELAKSQKFDVVVADAPCSGSGSWRRDPQGKWALSPERLAELCALQAEVLARAAELTAANGVLVYMTCSFLAQENLTQVTQFLQTAPEWSLETSRQLTPIEGGDGFFVARLRRKS